MKKAINFFKKFTKIVDLKKKKSLKIVNFRTFY